MTPPVTNRRIFGVLTGLVVAGFTITILIGGIGCGSTDSTFDLASGDPSGYCDRTTLPGFPTSWEGAFLVTALSLAPAAFASIALLVSGSDRRRAFLVGVISGLLGLVTLFAFTAANAEVGYVSPV